jgi:hypothetical protein
VPAVAGRSLADDAAIWRHTVHLQLQDAAIFETQFEDFAVLRNRR